MGSKIGTGAVSLQTATKRRLTTKMPRAANAPTVGVAPATSAPNGSPDGRPGQIRLRLRGIAAGIICFAALGKDATGRLKSSRFRSSLPMLASQVGGL